MRSTSNHPIVRLFLPTSPLVSIRERRASVPEVALFYAGIALLLVSYGFSLERWRDAVSLGMFCWLVLAGYCVALGNVLPWGRDKKGTNRYLEVMAAAILILLVIVANPAAGLFISTESTRGDQCLRMTTREWSLCLPTWALWVNGLGCLSVVAALAATLRRRKAM